MTNKDNKVLNEYEKYFRIYGDKFNEQLELEAKSKTRAEELLKASVEKAMQEGQTSSTKIGKKLVDVAWDNVRKNIKQLVDSVQKPKSGAVPLYTDLLKKLIRIYEDKQDDLVNLMTLSSITTMLDGCFMQEKQGSNSISTVAHEITDSILREANLENFIQQNDIKLERIVERGISQRVQQSYRMAYVRALMTHRDYQELRCTNTEKNRLGAKLIEMVNKGCDFFRIEEIYQNSLVTNSKGRKNLKSLNCIVPNEWLLKTWQNNLDIMMKYAHKFPPTIIPPKDWEEPYNGGYYGDLQQFASLIRLKNTVRDNIFIKNYKQKLANVDLSFIYKALNAMQQTPFKINKNILEVCQQIMASGGNLGGLPQSEPYPMLPELPEPYTDEELREHKKKQVAIIKRNQRRASIALRTIIALSTASKYKDYDNIYFPWNLDYRGRCYPIPTALSPQGDDLTKALLSFAEPEPCKNADDWKWLAIHGANLAGHDKITLEERIKWTLDNEKNIIASADDALGYTWWSQEAENDYPIEFLAFCYEWKRLQEYLKTNNNSCIGFKCYIPIQWDGSCSGLQHFSALLRDEIGGQAVNLLPSEQVQDIYNIVAQKVNIVLTDDAKNGNADDVKRDKEGNPILKNGETQLQLGTKNLAQQWLIYAKDKFGTDGITRKVCKRSVMTLAYGSGRYGFAENLMSDIINPYNQSHPDTTPFILPKQSASYMAGLIWEAVSKTVVKAVQGMKFLQDTAKLICKNKNVVTWITPNGLPVQQNYMEVEPNEFQMRISGKKYRFYAQEETGNIDAKGQAQGIAPNYIHSMDACHLQRVVVASFDKGVRSFAMIHDSFGTDLANAGYLFKTTREQFVLMYNEKDYLTDFLNCVMYLFSDDVKKIPVRPSFGKLDITKILDSDFCFC